MPIRDIPFIEHGGFLRPVLGIKIINPETGLGIRVRGLIDTGADECAIPSYIAKEIGHNLTVVTPRIITTGNGETEAYPHTTEIRIYHPKTGKLLHTIPNTPVDYVSGLETVLLGVNNFLDGFILTIDYQRKIFSVNESIKRFNP